MNVSRTNRNGATKRRLLNFAMEAKTSSRKTKSTAYGNDLDVAIAIKKDGGICDAISITGYRSQVEGCLILRVVNNITGEMWEVTA